MKKNFTMLASKRALYVQSGGWLHVRGVRRILLTRSQIKNDSQQNELSRAKIYRHIGKTTKCSDIVQKANFTETER